MTPESHLVCFADARYRPAQQRLIASARRHGVNHVHAFSDQDLRQTDFYAQNKSTLSQPRLAGYALWKPFFILRVLRAAAPGDFVLYMDSDSELVRPPGKLFDCCSSAGGVMLFRSYGARNRYWTKRDCFSLMGCDSEEYHEADQALSGFLVLIAGRPAIDFVEEWLRHSLDPRKLTDLPSQCARPELPDFIEHRHEQSILSLMAHAQGRYLFRDPSQFGNHRKPAQLRVPGEYLKMPHSGLSCENSPYPTMINLHGDPGRGPYKLRQSLSHARARLRAWLAPTPRHSSLTPSDLGETVSLNRASLAAVSRWSDSRADARSIFGYGVPARKRHLLNRPAGLATTSTDLLVHLGTRMSGALAYLEVGVSVGKNFYQMLRSAKGATLHGFDLEEIHPNLSSRLIAVSRVEWPSPPESARHQPSSLGEYREPVQNNRVWYLSGDTLDELCWQRLAGLKFNLITLNGPLRPQYLMHLWRTLRRFDLIDSREFAVMWDIPYPCTALAFDRIAAQARSWAPDSVRLRFALDRSTGLHAGPQTIGVLAKLHDPPSWFDQHRVDQINHP